MSRVVDDNLETLRVDCTNFVQLSRSRAPHLLICDTPAGSAAQYILTTRQLSQR